MRWVQKGLVEGLLQIVGGSAWHTLGVAALKHRAPNEIQTKVVTWRQRETELLLNGTSNAKVISAIMH